jgi:hypothetical protein
MGGFRNSFQHHSRVYGESFTFECSLKMGLRSSIANPDPGSGAVKIRFRDEHHISVSLETIFGFKILKLFDVDPNPGSGIFLTRDPGWKN